MARRRPTAFEVSFPEEARREEELRKKREDDEKERKRLEGILIQQQVDQKKLRRQEREREKQLQNGRIPKRAIEDNEHNHGERTEDLFIRPAKKRQQDLPTEYYSSKPDEIREKAETFLEGEDELFDDDDEEPSDSDEPRSRSRVTQQNQQHKRKNEKKKPIRLLTHFTIFDARHRNEFVVLSKIEEEDGLDRRFEVAGWVVPYYFDEEDLVGEDTEEGDGGGGDEVEPVYMRLGPVLKYSVDWTKDKDPFYIETPHAWYILKMPADKYTQWYQEFYTPRRVTQIVIAHAIKRRQMGFDAFVQGKLRDSFGIFGDRFEEDDIWDAAEIFRDAVNEVDQEHSDIQIRRIPIISHILKNAPTRTGARSHLPSSSSSRLTSHLSGPPQLKTHAGLLIGLRNPDLAVLKPENQNPTHVTPLIASLARGFVNEKLAVIGPPPAKGKEGLQDDVILLRERKAQLGGLWKLIQRVRGGVLDVDWRKEDRVSIRSNYLKQVMVGGQIYKPGNFVLVPHGKYGTRDMTPEWPKDVRHIPSIASIANYFWFARIMYIKNEEQIAHVQWLEHASQTMIQEFANPQELYFCDLCNPVPLNCLVAKVKVHLDPRGSVKSDEYFVRYIHDKMTTTYIALPRDYHRLLDHYTNPLQGANYNPVFDFCPPCLSVEDHNQNLQWRYESHSTRSRTKENTREKDSENKGITYGGQTYHIFDFVLYRAEEGPSHIGQIMAFIAPGFGARTSMTLRVKKVGRTWDLIGKIVGTEEEIKDERHLFLTNEEQVIPYMNIVNKAIVLSRESFGQRIPLRKWLAVSPYHFYIQYRFPSLIPKLWDEKVRVTFRDLTVCRSCTEAAIAYYYEIQDFKNVMQQNPIRILDLFGGVGAFSLGLVQGSECMKLTHALEISPSAAKTIIKNHPGTQVFNQCVNTVLKYAIKEREGHKISRPLQMWDGKTPIPDVPNLGSVDLITAGFPCQTHSGLNMFKTANDAKSNLILTALSWVDLYRPKYVYMENVAGFLSFRLDTRQSTIHRVEGGVAMGGLKLLVHSLLEMGYQVRYSLLQAGHYGTPQRRVRFFLIAAQSTPNILPLPDLPQPTHAFNLHRLPITMPNGDIVRPIRPGPGTAPHPFISVEDAIGDLLRFDWKRPGGRNEPRRNIPALACIHKETHCGFKGRVGYYCEPQTMYQKEAREKESTDLQHFTKTVKARKVDRVLAIPMNPDADYRSLTADFYEWQFANPVSSAAKSKYRPGWYGRLDKGSHFPTIVTNIDPMAKQCKVLHPWCKRIVTVRELARAQGFPDWFVFEAFKGNVTTMHRQIGNAVPLPLGRALGREFRDALFKEWKAGRLEGIGARERSVAVEGDGSGSGGSDDEMIVEVIEDNMDGDQKMRDEDNGEDSDVDSLEGLYA